MTDMKITLTKIGIIHSPYKTTKEAPRQGTKKPSVIEIFEEYQEGLKDIEEFSHFHIYYYLHESRGYNLMVQTPWDSEKHGLFTTRSPHRPNPIGHSIVKLIKKDKNKITVENLDAIQGTPVIDIKPYVKRTDCKPDVCCGWIEKTDLMNY